MFYVYILRLNDGKHYVGYSADLKQRFKNHKEGRILYTRRFRPLKLIFYAAFESKMLALRFEKYLKSGSGFAFRYRHLVKQY